VKLGGQPLKTGLIEFHPADPGMATAGAATIADGAYALFRNEGLQPGKYEVRVSSAPQTVQRPAGAICRFRRPHRADRRPALLY
jgi:hypothetical protein